MAAERTDQEINRRRKLDLLRAQGIEPYQSRFDRSHSIAQALALFEEVEKSFGPDHILLSTAGRSFLGDFHQALRTELSEGARE